MQIEFKTRDALFPSSQKTCLYHKVGLVFALSSFPFKPISEAISAHKKV